MTFEIEDGIFYSRIWYITSEKNDSDWMGALFRKGDGPWRFDYRFRYYAGTPNDDDDRKSWYESRLPENIAIGDAIKKIKEVLDVIREQMGGEIHELMPCSSNPKVITAALRREKWAHFRLVDLEAISKKKNAGHL